MSNLEEHGKRELKALGYDLSPKKETPNRWIEENILELLRVFEKQGHSVASARLCVKYFKKLALFEPLSPLTGEDSEWIEVHPGIFQNKRCNHVFKENGKAFDIFLYTSRDGRIDIEFPYTPKTGYVEK